MTNLFDSANYPTIEPEQLVAGDRWTWKRTDLNVDYSNALYTLKYSARLEGDGSVEIEITAAASGDDYLVEVSQSDTASYAPGTYRWQAYITRNSDSERIVIGSGRFEVKANRDEATTDPRSHVKKVIESIEAVIEKRASQDQMSYTINGRTLARTPIEDLIKLRKKYKAEYTLELRKERIKNGKGHDGRVLVRF